METTAAKTVQQRDRNAAATIAAATVIVAFVCYWTVQIKAVRELLALAYG
jgi:Na+/proline symporter